MWEVASTKDLSEQEDMSVTLVLCKTDAWQEKFELAYTVTLKESSLELSLDVTNKNSETPFEFTTALHTYFKYLWIYIFCLSLKFISTWIESV